jgi:hypothetical protein
VALLHPYPHYRDVFLGKIISAVVAVPGAAEMRPRLRRILKAASDEPKIAFTFDLAFVLVAEAKRRGLRTQKLEEYCNWALDRDDSWGTRTRALNGRAGAHFRQGCYSEAIQDLNDALDAATGAYAGFSSLTLLAIADRCHEFGQTPEMRSRLPAVQAIAATAMRQAGSVLDRELAGEREMLVRAWELWHCETAPAIGDAFRTLSRMRNAEHRTAYVRLLSAQWAALGPEAGWEGLKALVPLSLHDATTLDTVLGRLFGIGARRLSDEGVSAAAGVLERLVRRPS